MQIYPQKEKFTIKKENITKVFMIILNIYPPYKLVFLNHVKNIAIL